MTPVKVSIFESLSTSITVPNLEKIEETFLKLLFLKDELYKAVIP